MKKLKYCAVCGSDKIERFENQKLAVSFKTINKIKKINLSDLSFEKCLDCGEIYFSPQDIKLKENKLNKKLAEDRRKRELLTGEEIKEIREFLGYSQDQLDKLLGLGAKSFARWETYRVDQSKSADLLLRAIKKGGKDFLLELLKERKAA